MKKAFLIYVEGTDGVNSNKFYNMEQINSNEFKCTYGRVGKRPTEHIYSMSKWNSKFNSKLRKGYKDITELKNSSSLSASVSANSDFQEFYDIFSVYTRQSIRANYVVDGCTQQQMNEAQSIIDRITQLKNLDNINDSLIELFKVIPRSMDKVQDYLITDWTDLNNIVAREQNSLDGMASNIIMSTSDPYQSLGLLGFKKKRQFKKVTDQIKKTLGYERYSIANIYEVTHKNKTIFDDWVSKQENKSTQHLFHGTRNPNIFHILDSGLMIRPSNAAVISGAAYGDGVYHSNHAAKSFNYTGRDSDAIFFIQEVHMGNPFVYKGWYREGKSLSRRNMNYEYLKPRGYDSLYVEAGDGLLNSEYIVYNEQQTVTTHLIHFKK